MRHTKFLAAVTALLTVSFFSWAQTTEFRMIEDGGTGAYKAIVSADESLPDMSVYRPADLASAVAKAGKLPVIVFANGGCFASNTMDERFNSEIASHGYILIGIGAYNPNPNTMTSEQLRAAQAADGRGEGRPATQTDNPDPARFAVANLTADTSPLQLTNAINWIQKQNVTPTSEFYHKVDVDNIAVMGSSCGGMQALDVTYDTRVKTIILKNSGVFPPTTGLSIGGSSFKKNNLSDLKIPVMYMIGNEGDVAYPNATSDFEILTVPVVLCSNAKVGHEGTTLDPHGGEMGILAVKWLNWQLKGDKKSSTVFLNAKYIKSNLPDWTIKTKNIKK